MAHIDALRPPGPYVVAVELERDVDPAPYAAAGATWLLTAIDPHSLGSAADVADVRAFVRAGPPRP